MEAAGSQVGPRPTHSSAAGDHASKASRSSDTRCSGAACRARPVRKTRKRPSRGPEPALPKGAGGLKAGPSLQASATCPEVHTPAVAPATATGARTLGPSFPPVPETSALQRDTENPVWCGTTQATPVAPCVPEAP